MAEFKVFDFRSLDSTWLDITEFIANRLFRFCSCKADMSPNLVHEFCANLYMNEIDEEFDDSMLKL